MPKFLTIGYGDQAGYDRTPEAARQAAHAHDAALVRRGVEKIREVRRVIIVGNRLRWWRRGPAVEGLSGDLPRLAELLTLNKNPDLIGKPVRGVVSRLEREFAP